MRCLSAAPRHPWPQNMMMAVAVAFMLHPTLVIGAPHHPAGDADENHFVMFPGKATWGPSPLESDSLAAGSGSPLGKALLAGRPKDPKVGAFNEIKVGYPARVTTPQRSFHTLKRTQTRPLPLTKPTGYTVAASHSPMGPLVRLRGGISGDSPYVLTRRRQEISLTGRRPSASKPLL